MQREFLPRLICAVVLLIASSSICLADDTWRPIDPADLASKTPVVEKDADAEAIFWEVKIDGHGNHPVFNSYVRIKIFTERGVETQGKVDLDYVGSSRIEDIAGRTIKPNGTIVELRPDAVFDRSVIKVGGFKVNAKSFAMPAVEPGAIIEYRWRRNEMEGTSDYIRLVFQRDIPIRLVKYSLKRKSDERLDFSTHTFHGASSSFIPEKDGYSAVTMTAMPAFHAEPRMPPEDNIRSWTLVYYTPRGYFTPSLYWEALGTESFEQTKKLIKVNDEVRQAAASLVGDASTAEAKLARLYEFCQKKIKNLASPEFNFTAADREKFKGNDSPADTLRRGVGSGFDISYLFAALATAAGFDARICHMADRSDVFFDKSFMSPYFLRATNVAVFVDKKWRFFDPGELYLPFGMTRWQEEGVEALVTSKINSYFVHTPVSPPESTLEKCRAKLKLSESGSIEGDVKVEFSGHRALQMRRLLGDASPEEREKSIKEGVKARMSLAEISDIRIENIFDSSKPLAYSYHVKVPDYAQRTGKRIFVQPAFFQRGVPPEFSTNARIHPVSFPYAWSEDNYVSIELPEGFSVEQPESPQPFTGGVVSKYEMRLSMEGKALVMKRSFFFGAGGKLLFLVSNYKALKEMFDALHERDSHTVTLRTTGATPQ